MRLKPLIPLLCLLLAPWPAWGQIVKLPAEIRGGVGSWIIVAPEFIDGGKPKWSADPGLQEVRLDLLLNPEVLAQLKGRVYTSATPGRFKVLAWNAKGDVASDIATCWVVVGDPGPVPPAPPVPPGPQPPVPPPPVDPLVTFFQNVYDADTTLGKRKHLDAYIEVVKQGATALSRSPRITTNGQLFEALKAAAASAIVDATGNPLPNALGLIRQKVGVELTAALGNDGLAQLDRQKAEAALSRMATILEGVR